MDLDNSKAQAIHHHHAAFTTIPNKSMGLEKKKKNSNVMAAFTTIPNKSMGFGGEKAATSWLPSQRFQTNQLFCVAPNDSKKNKQTNVLCADMRKQQLKIINSAA